MNHIHIDTRSCPSQRDLENWQQAVCTVFGPIEARPLGSTGVRGSIQSSSRGEFTFNELLYQGISLHRRTGDLAHMNDEVITLTMPRSALPVQQIGVDRTLNAGDIYLFNHAVEYETTAHMPYQTRSIAFPAQLLRQRVRHLQPFYHFNGLCSNPVGLDLIRAFAQHLVQGLNQWSDSEYQRLSEQMLDLLGTFIANDRAVGSTAQSCTRTGHRMRAQEFIRSKASDFTLAPGSVAAACGISLAYLHEVFRDGDLSVEACIFEERLELARKLLRDPHRMGIPIRTLSYESGFNDPGHFTRKFKERFGMTPGEFRKSSKN